jgi:predicted permease
VALGCTVLIVALLLARSFGALMTTDPGFSTESLLTFRLSLTPKYPNAAQISAFLDSTVERVGGMPGVNSAAAVTQLPMSGASLASTFLLGSGDARRVDADLRGITAGYFDTMQMRVLGGRAFSARDTATTPGVAIVDEAFARKAWPGESAVGKRIRWFRSPQGELEVVGVVTTVRHRGFDAPPRETVYRPHTQYARPTMYVAVRTSRSPDAHASAAVEAIRALDSDQPVAEITTMSALAARSLAQPGIGATLSALFALIALALTAVGVYGVVAYAVSQRTREFGVRLALGASPGAIRALILGAGARTGLVGLLVGVPCGWVACRFVERTMALPVSLDVATLAAGMAVTIACTVGACWVPSLRASRVSPSEPLRGN